MIELENVVEIFDVILKVVFVIGKNISFENEEIWVLKYDFFIDVWGYLVVLCDYGFCWIGNLVNDIGNNVEKEDRVVVVYFFLIIYYFDFVCYFL